MSDKWEVVYEWTKWVVVVVPIEARTEAEAREAADRLVAGQRLKFKEVRRADG